MGTGDIGTGGDFSAEETIASPERFAPRAWAALPAAPLPALAVPVMLRAPMSLWNPVAQPARMRLRRGCRSQRARLPATVRQLAPKKALPGTTSRFRFPRRQLLSAR